MRSATLPYWPARRRFIGTIVASRSPRRYAAGHASSGRHPFGERLQHLGIAGGVVGFGIGTRPPRRRPPSAATGSTRHHPAAPDFAASTRALNPGSPFGPSLASNMAHMGDHHVCASRRGGNLVSCNPAPCAKSSAFPYGRSAGPWAGDLPPRFLRHSSPPTGQR
jgi:hypothetical protein